MIAPIASGSPTPRLQQYLRIENAATGTEESGDVLIGEIQVVSASIEFVGLAPPGQKHGKMLNGRRDRREIVPGEIAMKTKGQSTEWPANVRHLSKASR